MTPANTAPRDISRLLAAAVTLSTAVALSACSSSGGGGGGDPLALQADVPAQFDHMGAVTRVFLAFELRNFLIDNIGPALDELVDDTAGLFPEAENPESIDCPGGVGTATRELFTKEGSNPFTESSEDFDVEALMLADCAVSVDNTIDGVLERGINSAAGGSPDDVRFWRAAGFSFVEQDNGIERTTGGDVSLFRDFGGTGAGMGRMFLESGETHGGEPVSRLAAALLPAGGGSGVMSLTFADGDSARILVDRRALADEDCIAPGRFDLFLDSEGGTIAGATTAVLQAGSIGGDTIFSVDIDGDEQDIRLTPAQIVALRQEIVDTCFGGD